MEKNEFRAVIKHFYLKKWTGAQIKVELDEVHGDLAPSLTTIYFWMNEFKHGRTCTEDRARSGRPIAATTSDIVEKIHDMIVEDCRVKVRKIAETVGISTERVHNILHEKLCVRKLCARWVPQLLTFDQKRTRKDISMQCLTMFNRNPDFWNRFVTVDETWIDPYTSESKKQLKQWTMPSESVPKKAKTVLSTGKMLIIIFWDSEGIIIIDYLRKGTTITGEYYATLLDRLKEELKNKRPRLAQKKILLHQDNTPSRKSTVVMAKLHELGFELIPHPPYSPDLAPCDFLLFQNFKICLGGQKFSSNEEVIIAINKYFAGFETTYFSSGIKELETRWTRCITLDGEYVENILQNEKSMSREEIEEKMNLDESECCPRRSKRRQKRRHESNSEEEDETYVPRINGVPIIIKRKPCKKNKPRYSTPNGTKEVRTMYTAPIRPRPSSLPNERSNEPQSLQFPKKEPIKMDCQEAVVEPPENTVIPPPSTMNLVDSSRQTRYDSSAIPPSLYHTAIINQTTASYIRPNMVNSTFHQIILPPPPLAPQMQPIRNNYQSSQSLRNSTNAMITISKPPENRLKPQLIFSKIRSDVTLTPNIIDLDSDSDDEPKVVNQRNTTIDDAGNMDFVDISSNKIIPVALFSTENDNNINEDQPLIEVCTTLKRSSSFSDAMLTHSRELDTFLGNLKESMHNFFTLPNNETIKDKLAAYRKIKLFHKNMRETVFQLAHINDRVIREYNKWERSRETESETSSTKHSTVVAEENIDIPLNMTCINESDTESDCEKSEYQIMEPSDHIKTSNILEDLLLFKKSIKHCSVDDSAFSTENKAIQVYDVVSRDYEKCIGYSLLTKSHYDERIHENVLEPVKISNKNFDKYQEQFIFYLQHIEDCGIETEDMKGLEDPNKIFEESIISDSSHTLKFHKNTDSLIATTEKPKNRDQEENVKSCSLVLTNITDNIKIAQINSNSDSNSEIQVTDTFSKLKKTELLKVENGATTLNNDDVSSSKNAAEAVNIVAAVTENEEDCTIIDD